MSRTTSSAGEDEARLRWGSLTMERPHSSSKRSREKKCLLLLFFCRHLHLSCTKYLTPKNEPIRCFPANSSSSSAPRGRELRQVATNNDDLYIFSFLTCEARHLCNNLLLLNVFLFPPPYISWLTGAQMGFSLWSFISIRLSVCSLVCVCVW